MPNRAAHAWGAGIAAATTTAYHELKEDGKLTWKTPVAGLAAGAIGSLPDMLEPATSPMHRQFFHSAVFAAALGYGGYRLYQWKPESEGGKLLRWILLVAVGAYLTHLAMDLLFSRSGLPVVGKL